MALINVTIVVICRFFNAITAKLFVFAAQRIAISTTVLLMVRDYLSKREKKSTPPPSNDLQIIVHKHVGHTYVIIWISGEENKAICTTGRWALNPRLKFDWLQAMLMQVRIVV